jgi:hypothetical protein
MKLFGKVVEDMGQEIMGTRTTHGNVSCVMSALRFMLRVLCESSINIYSRGLAAISGIRDTFEAKVMFGKALALNG